MKRKHLLPAALLLAPQVVLAAVQPGTDPRDYSGSAWSPYLAGAGIVLAAPLNAAF